MSQLSRHDLDSEFAKDEAVFSEPREVDLWPKNVHPHRFVSKGFRMEARITLSALRRRANPKRFMVYGRPRSGTTLLNHLLNQLPDVQADGELMHFGLARPHSFPAVAARNSKRPFYGFKLLSYQSMDVQRITRPLHFLIGPCRMGTNCCICVEIVGSKPCRWPRRMRLAGISTRLALVTTLTSRLIRRCSATCWRGICECSSTKMR